MRRCCEACSWPPAAGGRTGAGGRGQDAVCGRSAQAATEPSRPAVDAAHDGDVVRIARGTFLGGVKIGKSIRLQGSGADATRIAGGGPVLTLGTFGAASEPTISVDGVTITHGKTTSSPDGAFAPAVVASSLRPPPISPSAQGDDHRQRHRGQRGGAVVYVAIAERRALPGRRLPYAEADGGGIDNAGTLTLDRVVVANNRAGWTRHERRRRRRHLQPPGRPHDQAQLDRSQLRSDDPPKRALRRGRRDLRRAGTLTIKASSIDDNSASAHDEASVVRGQRTDRDERPRRGTPREQRHPDHHQARSDHR